MDGFYPFSRVVDKYVKPFILIHISFQTLADPTAVLLLSMFLLASSQEVTETASEVDDQEAVASEEDEDKVGKPVVSFAVPQLYNAGQLYPVLVSMREKSVISFILRANPQYQN